VASLVCAGKGAKTRWMAATPLGRTGQTPEKRAKGREAVPPPEFGPPADQLHDPGLVENREMDYALAGAFDAYRRLLAAIKEDGGPFHDMIPARYAAEEDCRRDEFYLAACEAWYRATIAWPWLFADPDPDPVTEADALDMRLTVFAKPPRERRPAPSLPGCKWTHPDGAPCTQLRRFGDKFCPEHTLKELHRLRGLATR
jgi:hypothetical protein